MMEQFKDVNRRKSKPKEKLNIAMFGQKRIPSREGGVEIVVEELCTRMVAQGHNVTCYNRGGHHVSGSEYDSKPLKEYKGSILLICHEPEFYQDVVNEVWDMSKWTTKVF